MKKPSASRTALPKSPSGIRGLDEITNGGLPQALEAKLVQSRTAEYVLRLYVTRKTTRSMRAIENIRKTCDRALKNRYELTVVDLFENPEMAKEGEVIAAPTLLKTLPLPLRRLIGDLSDERRVLLALDIQDDDKS